MGITCFDFETHLISTESPIPKPVCISYYKTKDNKGVIAGADMEVFLSELLNSNDTIVCHNLSFEANVIDYWYPHLRRALRAKIHSKKAVCTKIYEQLIDCTRKKPLSKFSLDTLVNHYFEVDISEDKKNPLAWRLRYSELEGMSVSEYPQEAYDYALNDSIWTYKIYMEQKKTYIDIGLTVAAEYYLNKIGLEGIHIDQNKVLLLEEELKAKLAPKYDALIRKGLVEVNKKGKYTKKMKILRDYISDIFENPVKTKKGTIATSKEHLEKYIENQIIRDYLDIMQYEKILTAFVARFKGADIIRSQYNACVTTGRTSSSSSKFFPSVNIQQMPRKVDGVTHDVRNCFVARPGYKIVSIDYAGLELATCANQLYEFTGMSNMRDIINSGDEPIDMHSMLAYRIMNLKEGTKEDYAGFIRRKKEGKYKAYRQLAKPINLGFPGGIGYDTMRTLLAKEGIYPKLLILAASRFEDGLKSHAMVLRKEGEPVRIRRTSWDRYELVWDELVLLKWEMFKLYPDLEFFLKEGHLRLVTGESKKVKNEFGEWETEPMYRYRVNDFTRDWCMYTQVCNGFSMQAPAAQGAKRVVINVSKKYADSKTCRVLAFIHDELLLEVLDCPEIYSIIEDISYIMIESMQQTLKHVRITVEASICGDCWSKTNEEWSKTYWKNAP